MSKDFYKKIFHIKASAPHTLLLSDLPQFSKRSTLGETRNFSWCRILNPYTMSEAQNVRLYECKAKNLLFAIVPLIGISTVTLDTSHMSIRDMERSNIPLFLLEQLEDMLQSPLREDMMAVIQVYTLTLEKTLMRTRNMEIHLSVLAHFAHAV